MSILCPSGRCSCASLLHLPRIMRLLRRGLPASGYFVHYQGVSSVWRWMPVNVNLKTIWTLNSWPL